MLKEISSVLTVDNDPIIRQVITAFFARHGVENVWQAENGDEAISVLKTHQEIDLIVSDLYMPETDGVEFMAHLHEIGSRIPIIVVSSADRRTVFAAETLANAQQLNFIASLPKPLDIQEMEAVLGERPNRTKAAACSSSTGMASNADQSCFALR